MMGNCKKCGELIEETFDACWNCGTLCEGIEDSSLRIEAAAPVEQVMESVCSKCGSNKVIPSVRILDEAGDYGTKSLSVRFDRNPEAWIFKGSAKSVLQARVCGACGYAELYATHPEELWSAFEEHGQA